MMLNPYLRGEKLYGDDMNEEEIRQWYADEENAYANLGAHDRSFYSYEYHALNFVHGYRHLPNRRFEYVLGFGSAYGDELKPIASRSSVITIIDPSPAFDCSNINNIPVVYQRPQPSGQLELPDCSQDLVVCFGVLHHIPNVSFVVKEMARVLKKDGYFLMREPIVSMGDWSHPRNGLTMHERGIPLSIMRKIISSVEFSVCHEALLDFPLTHRIFGKIRKDVFNSKIITHLDAWAARFFSWNVNYHAASIFSKLRPTSAFWVLRKN